jgi:hypothetical protein
MGGTLVAPSRLDHTVMARAVQNLSDFAEELSFVRRGPPQSRPRMLAFLLFDERASHRAVMQFAYFQFHWLDSLAASNQMVLFFFLPESVSGEYLRAGPEGSPVVLAPRSATVKNPSLVVADCFGLAPTDLPGLVFFADLDVAAGGHHDGVYWPLPIELFDEGGVEAENELAVVFELVQAARLAADKAAGVPAHAEAILEKLDAEIEREHRADQARPIFSALRAGALRLVTSPEVVTEVARVALR